MRRPPPSSVGWFLVGLALGFAIFVATHCTQPVASRDPLAPASDEVTATDLFGR